MKEVRDYSNHEMVSVSIYDLNEYPLHYHDAPEMIFVLAGEASVNTSFYSDVPIKTNDFIFINGNTVHSIRKASDDTCRVMSIHFNIENISKLFNIPAFSVFSVTSFDEFVSPEIVDRLRRYLVNLALNYFWPSSIGTENLADIVLDCYTYMLNNFQWFYYDDYILHNYPHRLPLSQVRRAEEICTYLQEHYSEKLTLSEVADAFFLNKYYLSHLMKDTLGISFQDILNAIRLNMALYPLLDSSKSVEEIADECGFSSAVYFRKAFGTQAKVPLSKYRRENGKWTLNDKKPDIVEYDDEIQLEQLIEYQKIYYPGDFLAETTERMSVYIVFNSPVIGEGLPQPVHKLKLTPETLLHPDLLEEALEDVNFNSVFARKEDFLELYDAYGSWEFFKPTEEMCSRFGISLELETNDDDADADGLPFPSVCGSDLPMYNEKGLRTKWYYLFFLASRLYDDVIYDGESCTITKENRSISILCHNVNMNDDNDNATKKEVLLHIKDIECNYSILTYTMDFHGENEAEMWELTGHMGNASESMKRFMKKTVRGACFPEVSHTRFTAQYDLLRDITLMPGEVKLLLLIPADG